MGFPVIGTLNSWNWDLMNSSRVFEDFTMLSKIQRDKCIHMSV